ncbi:hypothetical protein [Paenibacillus sacheonensis]|uniref:Uncharacterized protein n=1 Tax=Paenibacillus sacheonensis TaxID=742054 RepID=A0A7X4YJL2_9BACL|nr:hypothetical protein [Paenibacillus sacheonensis]NBC67565.1 hypothetical protein [Paenibacillus sacheonensis]
MCQKLHHSSFSGELAREARQKLHHSSFSGWTGSEASLKLHHSSFSDRTSPEARQKLQHSSFSSHIDAERFSAFPTEPAPQLAKGLYKTTESRLPQPALSLFALARAIMPESGS